MDTRTISRLFQSLASIFGQVVSHMKVVQSKSENTSLFIIGSSDLIGINNCI